MAAVGQLDSQSAHSDPRNLASFVYTRPQMQEIEWQSVPTEVFQVKTRSSYALQPLLPAATRNCMRGVEDVRCYLPDFPWTAGSPLHPWSRVSSSIGWLGTVVHLGVPSRAHQFSL
jgi:hypothetical protein